MLCVSALMVLVLIGGSSWWTKFQTLKLYNAIIAYLNLEASLKSMPWFWDHAALSILKRFAPVWMSQRTLIILHDPGWVTELFIFSIINFFQQFWSGKVMVASSLIYSSFLVNTAKPMKPFCILPIIKKLFPWKLLDHKLNKLFTVCKLVFIQNLKCTLRYKSA